MNSALGFDMETIKRDEQYMELALDEARRAFEKQEIPVGALVVQLDPVLLLIVLEDDGRVGLLEILRILGGGAEDFRVVVIRVAGDAV